MTAQTFEDYIINSLDEVITIEEINYILSRAYIHPLLDNEQIIRIQASAIRNIEFINEIKELTK